MGNLFSNQVEFPITKRNKRKYGWIRDIPDHRDLMAQFPKWDTLPKKSHVDLRMTGNMPEVYNQGALGSCTAQAVAAAYEYDMKRQKVQEYFQPSRQFIYYNERVIEGTIEQDSGATLRDGVKVLHKLGVCSEDDCPYDTDRFFLQPSVKSYLDAQKHKAVKYRKVMQNDTIFSALTMGYPVVFGFSVYESFEDPNGVGKTGIATMPKKSERLLGGHAVMLCGYNIVNNKVRFLVRNSWGTEWGNKGYFWMGFDYVMNPNLCSDFWTIERITNPPISSTGEVTGKSFAEVIKESDKKEEEEQQDLSASVISGTSSEDENKIDYEEEEIVLSEAEKEENEKELITKNTINEEVISETKVVPNRTPTPGISDSIYGFRDDYIDESLEDEV